MPTLGKAWVDSAKKWGSEVAIIDSLSGSMSYTRMLSLTLILSKLFAEQTKEQQNVGIILPASLASALCNLSLLMATKTIVNLNFTAGQKAIDAAIKSAQIQTIYTSQKFMDKLEGKGVSLNFSQNVRVLYMEDLVDKVKANKLDFVCKMAQAILLPSFMLKWFYIKAQKNTDIAAILFSSGSEGKPKGVMLSHLNIMSNILQISDVIHARMGILCFRLCHHFTPLV